MRKLEPRCEVTCSRPFSKEMAEPVFTPKPVRFQSLCLPLILGIDGFPLMIEGPAGPLVKESLRPCGIWTGEHKWRKHCGEEGLRTKYGSPKGSEREQVGSGRGILDSRKG